MATRVMLNGKEVTNPATRVMIAATVVAFVGLVLAALLFVVLPLVGVVVSAGVGIAVLGGVVSTLGAGMYKLSGSVARRLVHQRRMLKM